MYEHKSTPMIDKRAFVRRMLWHGVLGITLLAATLLLGAVGLVAFEDYSWHRAFLNATTLLSGLGPAEIPETEHALLFLSLYSLLSGFVFVAVSGLLLAPVFHRILHRFHLDQDL